MSLSADNNCSFAGKTYNHKFEEKNGKRRVKFSIGVNKPFGSEDNKTAFPQCVIFGDKQVETFEKYVKEKQTVIAVTCGYDTWETGSGNDKHYGHNFVVESFRMLTFDNDSNGGSSSRSSSNSRGSSSNSRPSQRPSQRQQSNNDEVPEDNDDDNIPF